MSIEKGPRELEPEQKEEVRKPGKMKLSSESYKPRELTPEEKAKIEGNFRDSRETGR